MKLLDCGVSIIIALIIMLSVEFVIREVEFSQNKVMIEEKYE